MSQHINSTAERICTALAKPEPFTRIVPDCDEAEAVAILAESGRKYTTTVCAGYAGKWFNVEAEKR